MITLIHGDDTLASRNFYYSLKSESKDTIVFDGASLALTDAQQALSGDDLFGTTKDIFIENLLSKKKSQKELDVLEDLINQNSNATITLWEGKELTKKQSGVFPKATVKLFKIPSTIFALLDGLQPKNGKQLIELFHKTLTDKDAEFVLVMLQRQVRILLALSSRHPELDSGSIQIPEISRLAPWQMGKLSKQANEFTLKQLISLHTKLFHLEKDMKTGGLTQPLDNAIDFLLLSL